MNLFCSYIHCRPDGRPFYVGKGRPGRAYDVGGQRSQHYMNVVGACGGPTKVLVGKLDCSTEAIAFELEKGLIKCFRNMGIQLVNKTLGGEGITGFRHTLSTKQQMSDTHSGVPCSELRREAIRQAHLSSGFGPSVDTIEKGCAARRGKPLSPEHKARLSALRQGSGNHRFGKHWDQETKDRIAKALCGKKLSVSTKAKMQVAHQMRQAVREGRLFSLIPVKETNHGR